PHPRGVVRHRRCGSADGRQSAPGCGSARHHAGWVVGTCGEHADVPSLAGTGARSGGFRRPLQSDRWHRPRPGAGGHTSGRSLRLDRDRTRAHLPGHARHAVRGGCVLDLRAPALRSRRGHRSRVESGRTLETAAHSRLRQPKCRRSTSRAVRGHPATVRGSFPSTFGDASIKGAPSSAPKTLALENPSQGDHAINWRETLAPYAQARVSRGLGDLATSVLPYVVLSVAMYFSLKVS